MGEPFIHRIVRDAQNLRLDTAASYLRTYPEFLRYFAALPAIEEHHLIIGASFTYSWMPTILKLRRRPFAPAVEALNRARDGGAVSDDDITTLASLINNSMVGASKLLHFVNPRCFAIWDSNVARYLHGRITYACLHHIATYRAYLAVCNETTSHIAFGAVHTAVNTQVGYAVTPLRAVELVMYAAGPGSYASAVEPSP